MTNININACAFVAGALLMIIVTVLMSLVTPLGDLSQINWVINKSQNENQRKNNVASYQIDSYSGYNSRTKLILPANFANTGDKLVFSNNCLIAIVSE